MIVGEIDKMIVDPDAETLDGVMVVPSTTTVNALAVAVVVDIASEYVSVICVPAVFVAAETNEGAVTSTVELFVTEVAASEAASFPAESCTADASSPAVGSVYATVTA